MIKILTRINVLALLLSVLLAVCSSCTAKAPKGLKAPVVAVSTVPAFNADSAYAYVKVQTDFGPRVPNTGAHKACAQWLEGKLSGFGAETVVQNIQVTAFDGTVINGFNIIGRFRPKLKKRVIICSHWDSRPWADNDPDPANHNKPVDAANDGASGVAVILEIARQMQRKQPEIGVDCIFFDAEDWGPGDEWKGRHTDEMWGLGTQYWARRPHVDGYTARFAILLDMVGGKDAVFYREGYSQHFASAVVDKVWKAASSTGNDRVFNNSLSGYVTDDHLFINRIAGIPAIDIIPYYPDCAQSSFGPTWHTVSDNFSNISKSTLQAVGETVMHVIYNEK